jgi:ribonuclease P protein component
MRLNTRDVSSLLKRGKRVRPVASSPLKVCIDARVLSRVASVIDVMCEINPAAAPVKKTGARIAVAVPKRLLKKAVDRNLVKRWFREAIRQHPARWVSADILLTLTAKIKVKDSHERALLKKQLSNLLASVEGLSSARKTRARN